MWRAEGNLPTPSALRDLVVQRLAGLNAAERDLLERLALCGPVSVVDVDAFGLSDAAERLEQVGLVDLLTERRRRVLGIAHPMHADVLRDELHSGRAREIYLDAAEAIEARGMRRRTDVWRSAGWRFEAGAPVDPDLLLSAAETGRAAGDMASACRLAERVWLDRRVPGDGLAYGEALSVTGQAGEAEAVVAVAQDEAAGGVPPDIALVAPIALIADCRSMNAFWGLSDPPLARTVLQDARRTLGPTDGPALVGAEAWMLAFDGRPTDALALLETIDDGVLRARAVTAIPRATALTLHGRTAEAIEVAQQGQADRAALGPDPVAAAPQLHLSAEIYALTEHGRLVEGTELCRHTHDAAVVDDDFLGVVFMGLSVGRLWLRRGRPRTALRWFRQVQPSSVFLRPMRRLSLVGITVASVWLDDIEGARVALGELREVPPSASFLAPEVGLAESWVAWAEGRPDDARQALFDASELARSSGQATAELALLLDAARLGGAGAVASRVAELAAASQSPFAAAIDAFVFGLARDDADRLAEAGAAWEEMDARLLAAEAFVALAPSLRRDQQAREATAAEKTAAMLLESTEGARTRASPSPTPWSP